MSQQDFSMAFVDTADRLTALLIHGFPFSSAVWQLQIEDLHGFARLIAPDLRGHGQSDPVPGPYTMKLFADDCVDLLGHLGVAPPFVVSGMSMGGYIALEIVRRYPDLVGGLILNSTRAGADSSEGKENRNKSIKLVKEKGVDALVEQMLPKLFSANTTAEQPEIVEFVQEIMLEASPEGVVGALQAMRDREDSTDMLREISVPTLIVHGADDQLIPLSEARMMHKAIPHSKLVVIPNAGHIPNLENPDAYNDAVIDFLEEVDAHIKGGEDGDEEEG